MRSSKNDAMTTQVAGTERISLSKVILSVLAVAGLLAVAVVAPNVIQLLDLNGRARRYPRKQFRTALRRLEKRGYIRASDRTSWKYALTKEGSILLKKYEIDDLVITPPQAWDGKWRLVIFDIPEKYRLSRNALRETLQRLGFHYLNLSVWAYPFPCRNEINAIVDYFGIGTYVRYIEAETYDGVDDMERRFSQLLAQVHAQQRMASK